MHAEHYIQAIVGKNEGGPSPAELAEGVRSYLLAATHSMVIEGMDVTPDILAQITDHTQALRRLTKKKRGKRRVYSLV